MTKVLKETFMGRSAEFDELSRVDEQKKATLIVCTGRRRVGKSRLIQEFGKNFPLYIEVQGLAPRPDQTNQTQLDWFSREVSKHTGRARVTFSDWSDAFHYLADACEGKRCLILLDEISWMGRYDPDFPGKLKIAWDTIFKKNPRLRLVLCGSVSSWIQENILNATHFVGRISLELPLRELSITESLGFWGKKAQHASSLEILRVLSLTGGIPRYLEEIDYSLSAEANYQSLCFLETGFLFSEFSKIFNDVFEKKSEAYRTIVVCLLEGPKTASEIARTAKIHASGLLTKHLMDLELSGFVRREQVWALLTPNRKSKSSRYRISDCYLRFFLKYIEPNSIQIRQGFFKKIGVEKLPSFDSFVGLQFENLILNNLLSVCQRLRLPMHSIVNAGPYFQSPTKRKKGCQIDLLIQTKNSLYVCELKAKRKLEPSVIDEVKEKIAKLKRSRNLSIRPVLIHAGEISEEIHNADFFDKIISFDEIARGP
jgi:uncharacterized protein